MSKANARRWLLGILMLGLAARLALAWLPLDQLVTRMLPDDAFIYFVISRNIGAGLGATFDGVTPTNGFHPLWALALAPIFALWPKGALPVHIALTLSAAIDGLTIVLVFHAVRRLTSDSRAGLLSAGLYAFNPLLVFEVVNGLETSLGLMLLMLCFLASLRAADHPARILPSLLFGLCGGLMTLARTDLALVFGVLYALIVIPQVRRGARAGSRCGAIATLPLLAFGATLTPWLLWSRLRVGEWAQSSGLAIPLLAQYRIQAGLSDWPAFVFLWRDFLSPVLLYSLRAAITYSGAAGLACVLVLLGKAIRSVRARRPPYGPAIGGPRTWELARPSLALWAIAIGGVSIAVVHTLLRWYPRGWYFAPLGLGVALGTGPLLSGALESFTALRSRPLLAWALGGSLLIALPVAQAVKLWAEPAYAWQAEMLEGARWLKANTPPDAVVGSFNAGIYAYLSDRRLINLDGLTDWEAIRARQQCRLLDYLGERGGEYLIDFDAYIWASFGPFLGQSAERRLSRIGTVSEDDMPLGRLSVYSLLLQSKGGSDGEIDREFFGPSGPCGGMHAG